MSLPGADVAPAQPAVSSVLTCCVQQCCTTCCKLRCAQPCSAFFRWGRSAGCVRIDGPRILADAGPAKVGAALSVEACADGAHMWTLRRIRNGGSGISDYLGLCSSTEHTGLCPTSSSFNGFVVGFRDTAGIGDDLRYKNRGSLLQKWQHGLPTLQEEGSVLEITLDHEAGTVKFRAPELEHPYLGKILGTTRINEEDRGLPLHLYSLLARGNIWEVIESQRITWSRRVRPSSAPGLI